MRRLGLVLALGSLWVISGGQWMALQGFAWMGMLARYSSQFGITEGIRKTFDGKHPCTLCRRISKESGQQQRLLSQFPLEKQTGPMLPGQLDPTVEKASLSLDRAFSECFSLAVRTERPQVPPPRTSPWLL
jgi:hypothetical protein